MRNSMRSGAVLVAMASANLAMAVDHNVEILGYSYVPQHLTINVGDTVIWTNQDFDLHTVTSGADFSPDGVVDSPLMGPGATFSFTFNAPGQVFYYCAVHFSHMEFGSDYSVTVIDVPAGVDIISTNPPSAAQNPFQPGQPFRDVLDTGSTNALTAGIGGATPNQGGVSYDTINVTFSGPPTPAPTAANILVACTGANPAACPVVTQVAGAGAGPYAITLDQVIPPGECTTLTFAGTNAGQKLQYQSQPGNVSLDASTNTQDLLGLIQALNNGDANQAQNLARYNVDRSTGGTPTNTQDLLRLINLLNGTNTTQAFNGASVAACP